MIIVLSTVPVDPMPSPLDIVELPFMRTATVELLLLAVAGGLLGSFVVLRQLAFYSHAVGTATFPGLVGAEAAGLSPKLAGLVVGLGFAGGVERLGRGPGHSSDAATALLLVAALAGGVVLAGDVLESGAAVDRLLFGTLLGLDAADLSFSAGAATLAAAATVTVGRAWLATGFDPASAPALGLRPPVVDGLLLALVAVAVVAALPAVGALLVASLLVVPAATARLRATTVPGLLRLSVVLAVGEGIGGLYLALWLDVPPGPAVATLGAAGYALAALASAATGGSWAR